MTRGRSAGGRWPRMRGAAMLEFVLMAPVIALIGLVSLQWVLAFHARQQLQHAGFMAARAGAQAQAQPAAIEEAYLRALVPLYGGGRDAMELAQSLARARADLVERIRIEVLNPSAESFDDWADPALQARLRAAGRVIPNEGLSLLSAARASALGSQSGQTLADANQLQLRITTGLPLQVPFAAPLVRQLLAWTDRGGDAFAASLIDTGRLPSTVEVTVRMQSPAMESAATRSRAAAAQPRLPAGNATGSGEASGPPPLPSACSTAGCANGEPAVPQTSAQPAPLSAGGSASPTGAQAAQGSDPLFCATPG